MNDAALRQLEMLRLNYATTVGQPFVTFYCPILFRDEPVELCRAHVINSSFDDSDRRWTIQRKDVDGFYGSVFESDFIAIKERGRHSILDVLGDRDLARRLNPKILFQGKEVEHYVTRGPVPDSHSPFIIEREGQSAMRLVLKLETSTILSGVDADWEIRIEKDVRLAALASLLKAAHLTLFEMLGYEYALSTGGHFLGSEVLGKFFWDNCERERIVVLSRANAHFRQFANMVRPVQSVPSELRGTVTDRMVYLCTGTPRPWAFVVFVRTGDQMHAVLVPMLDDPESAARFVGFLERPAPRFEVRLLRFAGERWEAAKDVKMIEWPAANFE